jgi:copper chaperone CopZ
MRLLKIMVVMLISTVFTTMALAQKPGKNTSEVVYKVSIDCEGCKKKIEKNIAFEKGVKDLRIDMQKKLVTVVFDSTKTNGEKLKAAIEKLDFSVEKVPVPLK